MSKKTILTIVYILAILLLFVRIDLWWWGTKIHPIMAGWITLPMLYQLGVWVAGVILVYIVCLCVWNENRPRAGGKRS